MSAPHKSNENESKYLLKLDKKKKKYLVVAMAEATTAIAAAAVKTDGQTHVNYLSRRYKTI